MQQTKWLKQHTFISHSSEAGKSKIKAPAHSVPDESSLPGQQAVTFSLCPHMAERAVFLFSSSYKATNPIVRVSPSWPHLTLTTSQRPHLQIPPHWRLRLQYMNLGGGGHNSVHSTSYLFIHNFFNLQKKIIQELWKPWVARDANVCAQWCPR